MKISSRYFIGYESKIDKFGNDSLAYYAVERVELYQYGNSYEIKEDAITFTTHGCFPMNLVAKVNDQNEFEISDVSAQFIGRGYYVGPIKEFRVMHFEVAHSKYTNEKFFGSYLFLQSGVRATKYWYGENEFDPAKRPNYITHQEGFYISEKEYRQLVAHPEAIPDFYKSLRLQLSENSSSTNAFVCSRKTLSS